MSVVDRHSNHNEQTVSRMSALLHGFNQIMGNMSYKTFGCCSASKALKTTRPATTVHIQTITLQTKTYSTPQITVSQAVSESREFAQQTAIKICVCCSNSKAYYHSVMARLHNCRHPQSPTLPIKCSQ